ncbi:MAG TPA: hypothetical protein VM867_05365, partial [Xanthobacteraceae bacterium]|nr:hypothetical protein [Xanthobacteraceae bacterium]
MRCFCVILVGVLGLGIHSASANDIDFTRLQNLCRTTAAGAPSAIARSIADVAKKERDLFKGHVVDASGRILRFGNIEFEVDRAADGRPESRASIPWHNVQRYWNSVSDNAARQDGNDAQAVVTYPNISSPDLTPPQRNAIALKTLLNTIRKLNIPDEAGDAETVREALRES